MKIIKLLLLTFFLNPLWAVALGSHSILIESENPVHWKDLSTRITLLFKVEEDPKIDAYFIPTVPSEVSQEDYVPWDFSLEHKSLPVTTQQNVTEFGYEIELKNIKNGPMLKYYMEANYIQGIVLVIYNNEVIFVSQELSLTQLAPDLYKKIAKEVGYDELDQKYEQRLEDAVQDVTAYKIGTDLAKKAGLIQ